MNSTDEKMLELCFAQIKSYFKDEKDLELYKKLTDPPILLVVDYVTN
jgi:hypothetical protein